MTDVEFEKIAKKITAILEGEFCGTLSLEHKTEEILTALHFRELVKENKRLRTMLSGEELTFEQVIAAMRCIAVKPRVLVQGQYAGLSYTITDDNLACIIFTMSVELPLDMNELWSRVENYARKMQRGNPKAKGMEGRMAGWQPIETAPKGGPILLFSPEEEVGQAVGMWADDKYNGPGFYECINDEYMVIGPTHWQPLPEPPKQDGAGE